jgi:hypothetical protein
MPAKAYAALGALFALLFTSTLAFSAEHFAYTQLAPQPKMRLLFITEPRMKLFNFAEPIRHRDRVLRAGYLKLVESPLLLQEQSQGRYLTSVPSTNYVYISHSESQSVY